MPLLTDDNCDREANRQKERENNQVIFRSDVLNDQTARDATNDDEQ